MEGNYCNWFMFWFIIFLNNSGFLGNLRITIHVLTFFLLTAGGDPTLYSRPFHIKEVAPEAWDHTISPHSLIDVRWSFIL